MDTTPFTTVLIANRGEIARRIIRSLRSLGIRSVAIYSDADRDALHVPEADAAVCVGPAAPSQSYLRIDAVIAAARTTGAQAIHPGYGFLSENVAFARACAEADIAFIGPDPDALEIMGDKIRSKNHVSAAGVPTVAGVSEPGLNNQNLAAAARNMHYPILIKPSAGGGGKGMHVVRAPEDLEETLVTARRVAGAAFGDDTLLLEELVERPRHIEVQVLADRHGTVIHLGERECSLQRRHQKVVEEAPSVLLDAPTRARIGEAACQVARSVNYTGAGTVEFLVPAEHPDRFYFMEMNTRLQVEHPVTELVTGVDIVAEQVRVAAGHPLSLAQEDVELTGHAVEARLYAEDPATGFLPTAGTILELHEPSGPGIRVDSSLARGLTIGSVYDPMLAKVIAWGEDRQQALDRLDLALADTVVLGVGTNTEYLRALLKDPDVRAGDMDTTLIERRLPELRFTRPADEHFAAAAHYLLDGGAAKEPRNPWYRREGWRPCGRAHSSMVLVHGLAEPHTTVLDDTVRLTPVPDLSGAFSLESDGAVRRVYIATDAREESVWVGEAGFTAEFTVLSREQQLARELAALQRETGPAAPELHSPMPGTIVSVPVATGDRVNEGQTVVVVEAMKMEHRLVAPTGGTAEVMVGQGDQVTLHQLVARVVAAETPSTESSDPKAPTTDTSVPDTTGTGAAPGHDPATESTPAESAAKEWSA